MIPIRPRSVKIDPEISEWTNKEAERLGYSYNQFIVESLKAVRGMIEGRETTIVPKLVLLALTARSHEIEPVVLGKIWPTFREVLSTKTVRSKRPRKPFHI